MVFFERYDIGNVQAGVAEEIELVLQVKIEQSLHRTVRRLDAGFYSRLPQFLLHFHPFLVMTDFGAADGDGKPAPAQVLHTWTQDYVGGLLGSQRIQGLMVVFRESDV